MATNQQFHGGYQQPPPDADGRYDHQCLMPITDQEGLETVSGQTWIEQKAGYGGYVFEQHPAQNPAQQPMLPQSQPQPEPYAPTPEKRTIGGMRPMTFWLALLSGILLAAAIGAGAAAGVIASQKSESVCAPPPQSSQSSTSSASPSASLSASSSSSSSVSPSASPTGFVSLPIPPEGTPGRSFPKCPGADGTTTEVNGTDLVFRHECNTNYPGNDIGQIPLMTMEDCILLCASQNVRPQRASPGCVGVSWEWGDGWLGCFLKSGKGTASEREEIESAFLVDA